MVIQRVTKRRVSATTVEATSKVTKTYLRRGMRVESLKGPGFLIKVVFHRQQEQWVVAGVKLRGDTPWNQYEQCTDKCYDNGECKHWYDPCTGDIYLGNHRVKTLKEIPGVVRDLSLAFSKFYDVPDGFRRLSEKEKLTKFVW